ncbi:MAG: S9 family peptidase, partial [bacterium]
MFRSYGNVLILSVGVVLLVCWAACSRKIAYPVTRTVDVVDDYHGTQVADPYRWLEDDHSDETKVWVEAQNAVTFPYLKKIPQRKKIEERLTQLWNYEKYSLPSKEGGLYFFSKNDGLQNQFVLYVQQSLDAEARMLLDPNTLSEDGTVALTTTSVSEDGKNLMYGLSSGGSDWQEFRVRDIETGSDLKDRIEWVKFSGGSWSKDGKGFYYTRFPEPQEGEELVGQNRFAKVYFHEVGTDQSRDALIYEDAEHPDWLPIAGVTEDGKYLVLHIYQGTDRRNRIYYMKVDQSQKENVVKLLDDFDAGYQFIGNDDEIFYFQTDLDAPKGRVIVVDTR